MYFPEDKLVLNARTNFCASYLLRIQAKFWKVNALTTRLHKN